MATISIDKQVLEYGKQLHALSFELQYFAALHQGVYASFQNYTGSAKKEVDMYAGEQMKQLQTLCGCYNMLAEDIVKIQELFEDFDSFYETCNKTMGKDTCEAIFGIVGNSSNE